MSRRKAVFLYRHGPKASGSSKAAARADLSDPLSEKGERMMIAKAEWHVDSYGKPVAVYCSPAIRTYQTAMFFSQAAGRNFPIPDDSLLGRHEKWNSFKVGPNPTAVDFYLDKPALIKEEATAIFLLLKRIARGLSCGENAVCVGHGGLIEPTMAMAVNEINPQLEMEDLEHMIPADIEEGGAILFAFDEDNSLIQVQVQT